MDVPTAEAQRVVEVLNNASIKGRPVNAELAKESHGDGGFSRAPRNDRGGFARRPEGSGFNREARPAGNSSFGRGPRPEAANRQRRDRY